MMRSISTSLLAPRAMRSAAAATATATVAASSFSFRSSMSIITSCTRSMSAASNNHGGKCCNNPNHHHQHNHSSFYQQQQQLFKTTQRTTQSESSVDFTTRTSELDTSKTGGPPFSTLNHGDEYTRLFANNRKWVEEKTAKDPNYFKRLAEGQKPHYLLIGCSDSRAPPDQLTKTQPGEIFIHRNVANMVVHTDMNLMTVLQYAVENLMVKHVIVMGHYQCGGVKASMSNEAHGLIDKWLRNIKDVYRLHRVELDAIKDEKKRFDRMVELNVVEQVMNLYKTNIIQSAWARNQPVRVHGWVYDVGTGLVKDLEVERRSDWRDLKSIYEIKFPEQ